MVALLAACGGGEGKCEFPPCELPPHRCTQDADCFQTEFCDFQNDSCGANPNDRGFCNERPQRDVCEFEAVELVCGCDGVYHDSECGMRYAGTDRDAGGNCSMPADAFACGDKLCKRDTQICFQFIQEDDGEPVEFACEGFPSQCRLDRSCRCLRSANAFVCPDCSDDTEDVVTTCFNRGPVF